MAGNQQSFRMLGYQQPTSLQGMSAPSQSRFLEPDSLEFRKMRKPVIPCQEFWRDQSQSDRCIHSRPLKCFQALSHGRLFSCHEGVLLPLLPILRKTLHVLL